MAILPAGGRGIKKPLGEAPANALLSATGREEIVLTGRGREVNNTCTRSRWIVEPGLTQEPLNGERKQVKACRGRKKGVVMRAYFLFTVSGPLVILTSYDSVESPELLKRLRSKGIGKFVACEVPVELAKTRYGGHFNVVCQDLYETDDLRVLDYNGERAYKNFSFKELGRPIYHEEEGSA